MIGGPEGGPRIDVNEISVAVIGATHAIDAAKKSGIHELQRDAIIGLANVLANRSGAIDVLAATQTDVQPIPNIEERAA